MIHFHSKSKLVIAVLLSLSLITINRSFSTQQKDIHSIVNKINNITKEGISFTSLAGLAYDVFKLMDNSTSLSKKDKEFEEKTKELKQYSKVVIGAGLISTTYAVINNDACISACGLSIAFVGLSWRMIIDNKYNYYYQIYRSNFKDNSQSLLKQFGSSILTTLSLAFLSGYLKGKKVRRKTANTIAFIPLGLASYALYLYSKNIVLNNSNAK